MEPKLKTEKLIAKVAGDIASYGWHVLHVISEDDVSFSYTVGFTETLGHAEVLMSGLKRALRHDLLNDIGNLIKNGAHFKDRDLSHQVVKGLPVKFIAISDDSRVDYLRMAANRYGEKGFQALQCIWPDKNGEFQAETNRSQEILG